MAGWKRTRRMAASSNGKVAPASHACSARACAAGHGLAPRPCGCSALEPLPRRTAMEFRLIDRIRERTAQTRDDVRLGIGDDAALLAVPAGQELAVAIDTLVE